MNINAVAVGAGPASYVGNIKSANTVPNYNYNYAGNNPIEFTGKKKSSFLSKLALLLITIPGVALLFNCTPAGQPVVNVNPTETPIPGNTLETNLLKFVRTLNINPTSKSDGMLNINPTNKSGGVVSIPDEGGFADDRGYIWSLTKTNTEGQEQMNITLKREEPGCPTYNTPGKVINITNGNGFKLVLDDDPSWSYNFTPNKTYSDMYDIIANGPNDCIKFWESIKAEPDGSIGRYAFGDPTTKMGEGYKNIWAYVDTMSKAVANKGKKVITEISKNFNSKSVSTAIGQGLEGFSKLV